MEGVLGGEGEEDGDVNGFCGHVVAYYCYFGGVGRREIWYMSRVVDVNVNGDVNVQV